MVVKMAELRWNPILQEWVVVAAQQGKRPVLPVEKDCPFCPGKPETGTGNWSVLHLPNKFPALMENPPKPDIESDEFYQVKPSKGACEVLLYSPKHDTTFQQLGVDHICKIVEMWVDRTRELGAIKEIEYVFIFENTGREIGVSLDHPHGQLYAFPFIPRKIRRELDSAKQFMEKRKKCLFCNILEKEKADGRRIVLENSSFTAFIPFFATWPYGLHLYPNRHLQSLLDFTESEKRDLASILKTIRTIYDNLFGFRLPHMMAFHQSPTDKAKHPYYHFHVEFYPVHRAKDKIKYLAGVEVGTDTFLNPTNPEEKAKELREVKV
jgi:UDPglucose--hexose-1-phosphate uridylyltransferase